MACSTVPRATRPQAPTRASQGLVRCAGSPSTGRAPSFSWRVKHCMQALESRLLGFAEVEVGEQAPQEDAGRAQPRLLDPAQPAHELRQPAPRNAVGQQEIDVFLLRRCGRSRERAVIVSVIRSEIKCAPSPWRRSEAKRDGSHHFVGAGACALRTPAAQGWRAPAAVARQAPLARGALAHGAPLRRAGAVLRIRRGAGSSARTGRPTSRRRAARRVHAAGRDALPSALREERGADRRGHRRRLRPAVHQRATGCRFNSAASCASTSRSAPSWSPRSGVTITDLDGNRFYDLTGSYGVNVFGYDFYKECIARGSERVRDLGPVLGAYHPVTAYNVRRLLEISGLDEVSFHMSGTEAVMQAVRLARYHTGRSHLVRFCGAYHGWWGDVQPGVGNPLAARETYTLKDMDEAALQGAAQPARHRLRAGQPAAGAAPERQRAGRLHAHRQRPQRPLRPRRLLPLAAQAARGVQRARHRADFRRGIRRLPARRGRRAGILRRARRHGHLRQDGGRRPAGRRAVRTRASSCGAFARTGRPTSALRGARSTRIPTSWARCTNSCERLEAEPLRALYRDLDASGTSAPGAQRAA